ncbi:hypothetical protein BJX62DRAFT_244869 [Aspergillus germanicus]
MESEMKDRSSITEDNSHLLLDLPYCPMESKTGVTPWSSGIPEDVSQDHGKILQRCPRCHCRIQRRVPLYQNFQLRSNLRHWESVDRILTEVAEVPSPVSLLLANTRMLETAAASTLRDSYFRWTGRLYHLETGLGLSPNAVLKWIGWLSNYILRPSNNGRTARSVTTRPAVDILQPTGQFGARFKIFKEGENSTYAWAIMNRTFEVVMWDLDDATTTCRVPHDELRPLLDWALEQTTVPKMLVQELA